MQQGNMGITTGVRKCLGSAFRAKACISMWLFTLFYKHFLELNSQRVF